MKTDKNQTQDPSTKEKIQNGEDGEIAKCQLFTLLKSYQYFG